MKNKKVLRLTQGAVIAALYIIINYLQEMIVPTSTTMPVQFRIAEILTITAVITPAAIAGLPIGCLIANIISVGALPLDMVFGSIATFLAAYCAYKLKEIKWFTLPIVSSLMPVIFNSLIIGLELEIFYISGPFHFGSFLIQAGLVAIGEFVVCVIGGLPFSKLLEKINIIKK